MSCVSILFILLLFVQIRYRIHPESRQFVTHLLFVIPAQIEKCSQVIRDNRRTGSRAVLLCLPTLEKRCVIFHHLVLRHA